MKKISYALLDALLVALIPAVADAASYYNGLGYQKNNQSGYYNSGYSNTRGGSYANRYGNNGSYNSNYGLGNTKNANARQGMQRPSNSANAKKGQPSSTKQGFYLDASFSHEFARWDFEMTNVGSELFYDNLDWNVISAEGTYYFAGSAPIQLKVGARYGLQFGESSMIDDDISNGGGLEEILMDDNGTTTTSDDILYGYVKQRAIGIGTSRDGTQMGFNASLGWTDAFNLGKLKMTPSIGFRYLKYEVTTKKNKGLSIDNFETTDNYNLVTCVYGYRGEFQCDPLLVFVNTDTGNSVTSGREEQDQDGDGYTDAVTDILIPSDVSVNAVNTGNTYYYEQSGTSHKYETEWMGPYLALDMGYTIDNDNMVNAGIEFGLPMYRATGDQPYRADWQHPKSVEDKGEFGEAYHIGLNANWTTAISESTSLVLGFTYDYYSVSKADAKTYLNADYYEAYYNLYSNALENTGLSEAQQLDYQAKLDEIDDYRAANWVLEDKDEIKSIYKSMGIRAGIEIKF